jgi:hypothetical protein
MGLTEEQKQFVVRIKKVQQQEIFNEVCRALNDALLELGYGQMEINTKISEWQIRFKLAGVVRL